MESEKIEIEDGPGPYISSLFGIISVVLFMLPFIFGIVSLVKGVAPRAEALLFAWVFCLVFYGMSVIIDMLTKISHHLKIKDK